MSVPARLEAGNCVRLPAQWAAELGLHDAVLLDKTAQGILVRPAEAGPTPLTWAEIFATKLVVGSAPASADAVEEIPDEFLF